MKKRQVRTLPIAKTKCYREKRRFQKFACQSEKACNDQRLDDSKNAIFEQCLLLKQSVTGKNDKLECKALEQLKNA